jgi:acyl-CoA thioester hydrolase
VDLIETYRGDVEAWECDVFGHMNIAFYGERFGDAAASLLYRIAPGGAWRTVSLFTRYLKELRAGESISIRSGVIGTGAGAKGEKQVRIGHELLTSDGTVASQAEHALAPRGFTMRGGLKAKLDAAAAPWPAEGFAAIALPAAHGATPTMRDRVKSWELDERGELSLFGHVRRCSTASSHLLMALGMTGDYIQKEKRGFATFETRLALSAWQPGAGTEISGGSGLLEIGKSSVKMVHDLVAVKDGERIARCYQAGVHFDLEKRRSAAIPDELRAKAAALVIAR